MTSKKTSQTKDPSKSFHDSQPAGTYSFAGKVIFLTGSSSNTLGFGVRNKDHDVQEFKVEPKAGERLAKCVFLAFEMDKNVTIFADKADRSLVVAILVH